jgi:agmatine/peptidylarginine deiminase
MIFPERADSWQYGAVKARKAFAEVAKAIAKGEKVTMLASHSQYDNARRLLPDYIRVVEMSSDDAWARDVSPEFVTDNKGNIRGVDFSFNAWGGLCDGLYFPWDKDNAIAKKVCDLYDIDMYDFSDFVLEGGSISVDGLGTVMTTETCLLSKGRNPDLSYFGEILSPAEMGYLSSLINSEKGDKNALIVLKDSIKVILDEGVRKQTADTKNMSIDDWAENIQKIIEAKKKGN